MNTLALRRAAIVAAVFAAIGGAFFARSIHVRPEPQPNRAATFVPLPDGEAPEPAGPARRSPGCGLAKKSPVGTPHAIGDRKFYVWGPETYDPSQPLPIVLAFHGWSVTGRRFQSWFHMEDHVPGGALVVYPDAHGRAWDVVGDSDLLFIEDMLTHLERTYCVDRAHVLGIGFSYGAKLMHHVACRRPELMRAVVAGAGSMPHALSDCRVDKAIPILVLSRTHDPSELLVWGKAAAETWRSVLSCDEDPFVVDEAHGCVGYPACKRASVTFCEDTFYDPSWKASFNHTLREEYRDLAWAWFQNLP